MLDGDLVYRRRFTPLVARAGLRHIRLHDLRHTAARLMLAGGLLPHEVGRILGHSHPSTTLRLYAPWVRLNRPDVARVMGDVLRGEREADRRRTHSQDA
jgi:integrase